MNLHEYQASEIFAAHGIPTNGGRVAETPDEASAIATDLGGTTVIKAQVHSGGRGKAGGVKLAKSPEEAFISSKFGNCRFLQGLHRNRDLSH